MILIWFVDLVRIAAKMAYPNLKYRNVHIVMDCSILRIRTWAVLPTWRTTWRRKRLKMIMVGSNGSTSEVKPMWSVVTVVVGPSGTVLPLTRYNQVLKSIWKTTTVEKIWRSRSRVIRNFTVIKCKWILNRARRRVRNEVRTSRRLLGCTNRLSRITYITTARRAAQDFDGSHHSPWDLRRRRGSAPRLKRCRRTGGPSLRGVDDIRHHRRTGNAVIDVAVNALDSREDVDFDGVAELCGSAVSMSTPPGVLGGLRVDGSYLRRTAIVLPMCPESGMVSDEP